jgi:hypothetical protein
MKDSSRLAKAVTLHECLTCQDIPTVQRQIEIVTPMLLAEYDDNTERALDATLLDLEDYLVALEEEDEEDEDHTFFIVALWLTMVEDMGRVDQEVARAALVSGRTLTRGGATRVGGPLTAALREAAQPSADDLLFWFRNVLVTDPSIRPDFERLVREFLVGSSRGTAAKLSLIARLRELLLRGRRNVVTLTDLWAYRWHTIGSFNALAAREGVTIIAFNNPPSGPDTRTTPFCRWVHGKVIEVRRARQQIQAYLSAVAGRDVESAKASWPVLNSQDASGEGNSFEVSFRRLSLPPYHFFCRTVPVAR